MLNFLKSFTRFITNKIKNRKLVIFDYTVEISLNSKFEGMNKLHPNSFFNGFLGYGSYVGPNSEIRGKVGRFTSIAPDVKVNGGVHPFEAPYVSTSPCFVSLRKQNGSTFATKQTFEEIRYADTEKKYSVVIGNDCWIGQGAFIVGGVTIGDGAVVLAHALVSKDVPPYAIVGGVPAKIIKYRYDDETIQFLMNLKWWDKDVNWLKENIDLMQNIELLKQSSL